VASLRLISVRSQKRQSDVGGLKDVYRSRTLAGLNESYSVRHPLIESLRDTRAFVGSDCLRYCANVAQDDTRQVIDERLQFVLYFLFLQNAR